MANIRSVAKTVFLNVGPEPLSRSALCFGLLVIMGTSAGNSIAGNEIYVCTDSNGTRVYQNTGPSDACRRLNIDPVLSVPQPGLGNTSKLSAPPSPGVTAGQVPSQATPAQTAVNRESLQARESDRLRILETELREEEQRLRSLQQRSQAGGEGPLAQEIARSQASLDALRREIGKVRRP